MECPRCSGSGVCNECQGKGFQECPACSGEGQRTTPRGGSYKCKSCSGTGKIDCPETCSSCEGSGAITEELQQAQIDKYKMRFANLTPNNKIIVPIIVLNLVVFAIAQLGMAQFGQFVVSDSMVDEGYWWAFLTASFVHFDVWHIGLNCVFLWYYGPTVEGLLGSLRFALTYLVTALSSSIISWLCHHYTGSVDYWAFGASGPAYGIVGVMLALHWRWGMLPWGQIRNIVLWCSGLIVVGIVLAGAGDSWFSHIDNWAHFGGFVGGFLLTAALPRPKGR